jgi:hypothetical protein
VRVPHRLGFGSGNGACRQHTLTCSSEICPPHLPPHTGRCRPGLPQLWAELHDDSPLSRPRLVWPKATLPHLKGSRRLASDKCCKPDEALSPQTQLEATPRPQHAPRHSGPLQAPRVGTTISVAVGVRPLMATPSPYIMASQAQRQPPASFCTLSGASARIPASVPKARGRRRRLPASDAFWVWPP